MGADPDGVIASDSEAIRLVHTGTCPQAHDGLGRCHPHFPLLGRGDLPLPPPNDLVVAKNRRECGWGEGGTFPERGRGPSCDPFPLPPCRLCPAGTESP